MSLDTILDQRDAIIAAASAVAVFCSFIVISWPYMARDTLTLRMKQVAAERERIRVRERARLGTKEKPALLRRAPRKLFQEIVDRFNLGQQAEDKEIIQTLRMAGYRGHGPVIAFLALRLLAPIAMFAFAAFYVFVVLQLERPFVMKASIAVWAGLLGYFVPGIYVKNRITKRQQAIRRAWPDAVDLMLICVESGMSIESAFRKVAEEIGVQCVELAEELSLTTAELSYLQDRRTAYENLGLRTGLEGVKSVVTSLLQSEKYGTPLGQALRVMAQENRDMRMSEAEKKAASLPPKLTVPMILFFLPVLFAVIITPAAIQIMNQ